MARNEHSPAVAAKIAEVLSIKSEYFVTQPAELRVLRKFTLSASVFLRLQEASSVTSKRVAWRRSLPAGSPEFCYSWARFFCRNIASWGLRLRALSPCFSLPSSFPNFCGLEE